MAPIRSRKFIRNFFHSSQFLSFCFFSFHYIRFCRSHLYYAWAVIGTLADDVRDMTRNTRVRTRFWVKDKKKKGMLLDAAEKFFLSFNRWKKIRFYMFNGFLHSHFSYTAGWLPRINAHTILFINRGETRREKRQCLGLVCRAKYSQIILQCE